MSSSLQHQRVLVTGASKGIGRAIAVDLAKRGAKVIAVARTAAELATLRNETGCETQVADLESADAIAALAKQVGVVDHLVNNAGVSFPQSVLEATVEAFERTMALNVRAPLLLTQKIAA